MSDENSEGLFKPADGDPGTGEPEPSTEKPLDANPEETAQERPEPQFVTEDALNKRLEDFERKVQSSRDSALSTFDKRIKQKIETVEKDIDRWRKQGVKITAEQEQQRRLDAISEAITENEDAGVSEPKTDQANQSMVDEKTVNEVNARAYQISQQAGINLEEGDPELLLLDQSSPETFLSSFRNALYQKKLRSGEPGAPPQARIPSMGQQTKAPPGSDEQFIKEYKAAAGQGLGRAREIRNKWADKGVDVNTLIEQEF